ncbi:hypothetical protein OEZ85_002862 [Tetradesmus obliquus]|uniref:Armadillo repeat-containing domain-containing protein n=1 Tax=Tetradesmus obliquus TaxID=3088 RepID=A0ABY8TYU9_TETOB|nr:hypothetical protein OEZ85_002862 [Tetradesmus obliquus]
MAMVDPVAAPYNEKLEASVLELLPQLTGACNKAPWPKKEQALQQLNAALQQHARETQEAILCAGPTAVLDSILAILVSERTQLPSKLLAADVLSCMCSGAKACLLLCPSSIVERLMRCAYRGDADVKAAAARALWQLSCLQDCSPEVVSHAGNAFKVVELLAQDIQGGSATCMCALRATQNLLHTYATSAAGDAGDRIALQEGRRALDYADGFAALSAAAQACPEQQLCRLLAKLTKGCAPGSQDLAALAANAHLVAVLVRCCSPADRKTCKRALQVMACQLITVLAINNDVKRQLFHSDAVGPLMQLAEAASQGSPTQEAIRAALAQLGLVYLLPAPPAAAAASD